MAGNSNDQFNRMKAATNNGDRRNFRKFGGKNYNLAAFIALLIIGLICMYFEIWESRCVECL